MSGPVIEPVEILTEKDGTVKEKAVPLCPWARFLARTFDYGLIWLLLGTLQRVLHFRWMNSFESSWVPLEIFAWIPIEACFLSTLGGTFGKFWMRIQISQGRRIVLDFRTALKRSFLVWFRGIGMGLALVAPITAFFSYYRLKTFRSTSWDFEENIRVLQKPIGTWRYVVAAIISVGGFLLYYA